MQEDIKAPVNNIVDEEGKAETLDTDALIDAMWIVRQRTNCLV